MDLVWICLVPLFARTFTRTGWICVFILPFRFAGYSFCAPLHSFRITFTRTLPLTRTLDPGCTRTHARSSLHTRTPLAPLLDRFTQFTRLSLFVGPGSHVYIARILSFGFARFTWIFSGSRFRRLVLRLHAARTRGLRIAVRFAVCVLLDLSCGSLILDLALVRCLVLPGSFSSLSFLDRLHSPLRFSLISRFALVHLSLWLWFAFGSPRLHWFSHTSDHRSHGLPRSHASWIHAHSLTRSLDHALCTSHSRTFSHYTTFVFVNKFGSFGPGSRTCTALLRISLILWIALHSRLDLCASRAFSHSARDRTPASRTHAASRLRLHTRTPLSLVALRRVHSHSCMDGWIMDLG